MRVLRYTSDEYVETETQTFEPLFSENTPLINGEIVLTIEEYREVLNTYKQLQQERERAEQYRMAIADAYSQLPEISNARGCPVCHRFVWSIKDHKANCLYKILDDALSK